MHLKLECNDHSSWKCKVINEAQDHSIHVGSKSTTKFVENSFHYLKAQSNVPLKLITTLKPDIIFKGKDYKLKDVVGSKEVSSWGGETKLIDYEKGKSTTILINRYTFHCSSGCFPSFLSVCYYCVDNCLHIDSYISIYTCVYTDD